MAGRPNLWNSFEFVSWARHYQYTYDGRVRDRSKNVLTEHGPDFEIVLRIADTSRQQSFPKRDILALEHFGGYPPHVDCVVCSKRFHDRVTHLNGNRADCSLNNLKYVTHPGLARHQFRCVEWCMTTNDVPPAGRSVSNRAMQIRSVDYESDRWGTTTREVIPLLGVNPRR